MLTFECRINYYVQYMNLEVMARWSMWKDFDKGSNGDDSHAYDACYKKLLSSVNLTKDFVLAAHTQLCKAYKGIYLLIRLRGCHMKTCLFGIVLYVVANMPF